MDRIDETYAEYLARTEAEQRSGARKQMPMIESIWQAVKDRNTDAAQYMPGARLRHIDGTEATVSKFADSSDYVVTVEDDGGFDQLWPRDEIAGFGTITL